MNTLSSLRRLAPVALCALLALGCTKQGPPLAPVKGKVTVDNQAVTSGHVSLVPVQEGSGTAGMSSGSGGLSAGIIDSSGNYTIFTGGKEGAPLGKYKVTVNPTMVPAGDKGTPARPYNEKFSNARTTTIEIEVVANPDSGRYDLKLTK
jgi:hypothetical protein